MRSGETCSPRPRRRGLRGRFPTSAARWRSARRMPRGVGAAWGARAAGRGRRRAAGSLDLPRMAGEQLVDAVEDIREMLRLDAGEINQEVVEGFGACRVEVVHEFE